MYDYKYVFLDNKYTRWYLSIIRKANSEQRIKVYDGKLELHHIIPKSLGGNNSKFNVVLLTCNEHYVCHLLLTKMVINDHLFKMLCAFKRMSHSNRYSSKLNSKLYSKIKFEHATLAKEKYTGKSRPRHVIDALIKSNKGRIVSEETKLKLRTIWLGTTRSEEDKRKISIGQTGVIFTENRKKNIIKGRCIKFLQKFYKYYDELTEETFNDAKDKLIIKRRTCLSLALINKYFGTIPSKVQILQKTYV